MGNELEIENVVAEALPIMKKNCVQDLQQGTKRRRVCFVGDGMNDSAALAQADAGIAFGVGADVAMKAADATLVRCELSECVALLALSRRTYRTIIVNFFWAFCFNFLCLPLAVGVFYPKVHIPPLAAGVGMASSSFLVTLSSLSIRGFRPPPQPVHSAEETPLTPQQFGATEMQPCSRMS